MIYAIVPHGRRVAQGVVTTCAMHHTRIRPEYRLIQGKTEDEVVAAAAPFLKDGWVALYDPIFGKPAAWENNECWSQTLFRAARKETEPPF